MRDKFPWYFKPLEAEIEDVWANGILTIDANVLLDLYRYHKSTRESIIKSIKDFKGCKWISYQATDEFLRNREAVIAESKVSFDAILKLTSPFKEHLTKLETELKAHRLVHDNVLAKLKENIGAAIKEYEEEIDNIKKDYYCIIENDDVLEIVLDVFRDAIGDDFPEEQKKQLSETAKSRIENKIPPGYMDSKKEGGKSYGDYYMWKQILDKSKKDGKQIIFVTSDLKEDWWQKSSGLTIGPRVELIKEAIQFSDKRIFIYSTDRFLKFSLQRNAQPENREALAEIRALQISKNRKSRPFATKNLLQQVTLNTKEINTGELFTSLQREVRNITITGHFSPPMVNIPDIEARLVKSPANMPKFKLNVGAGTVYDFNVHIICCDPQLLLPVGDYQISYTAYAEGIDVSDFDDFDEPDNIDQTRCLVCDEPLDDDEIEDGYLCSYHSSQASKND